jgi:hypothetical protein
MSTTQFLALVQRNISPEIFFNTLLSDEDLSKLLCTCRVMKCMILEWKNIFPIEQFNIKISMTDKMMGNLIQHYSHNIKKLSFPYGRTSLSTLKGYLHLSDLHMNLLELNISDDKKVPKLVKKMGWEVNNDNKFLEGGVYVISYFLVNLKSLKITFCNYSIPSEEWDSLSKLTNLENLVFVQVECLDDCAVKNYSALSKLKSLNVYECQNLSELGLSYLVANKPFLVELKLNNNDKMDEFQNLSILTNLSYLTIRRSDDIRLNMICSSCLLIEYLDVRYSLIQIEDLENIHLMKNLKSLYLYGVDDDCLAKLTHNTALTYLELRYGSVSNEGISQLSSIINLKIAHNPYDYDSEEDVEDEI